MAEVEVSYPLDVVYCGNCSMQPELCEYSPEYEKCKEWLQTNFPDMFDAMMSLKDGDAEGGEKKKKQKRGGKGVLKTKKKAEPQTITIRRQQRNKKKTVTIIKGLNTHDIELATAAKHFAQKFSCGSSVTGDDEIIIQGDVTDDVIDLLEKKYSIEMKYIEDLGMKK
ncbi:density-regulated protein homolog [Anneissia japonica]|uniref:density-regulated protein homolog n=1 Tax=Anneissia japonica TaxID=1529436 RepID=UPI00142552B3|nr:density-regulated protein homolog [Anneissia japonica]XP_033098621.1 density-regulated protein homolog [Anneissia japonica]